MHGWLVSPCPPHGGISDNWSQLTPKRQQCRDICTTGVRSIVEARVTTEDKESRENSKIRGNAFQVMN